MSLSIKKRWEIVFLKRHRLGPKLSNSKISKELKIAMGTVRHWLEVYDNTGDVQELSSSGRPKSTSIQIDEKIVLMAENDPEITTSEIKTNLKRKKINVSTHTIKRRLHDAGLYSKPPLLKPYLKINHIEKRLTWALANRERDWNNVIFTDESTIQLFANPSKVWKRKGEKIIAHTVKHPPKIHIWGSLSSKGFGKLIIFTGILDSTKLCKIYKKGLLPVAKEWFGDNWLLYEDNDPKHKSRYSKAWKSTHSVNEMTTPAQSPDMNPIENVWHLLKRKITKKKPKTLHQLIRITKQEWNNFTLEMAQKFVNGMSRRIMSLIEAKGDITEY